MISRDKLNTFTVNKIIIIISCKLSAVERNVNLEFPFKDFIPRSFAKLIPESSEYHIWEWSEWRWIIIIIIIINFYFYFGLFILLWLWGGITRIKQIHWASDFLLGLSQHVDLDVATYLAWGQPPLVVADGLFNRMVFNGMDSFNVYNSSCMWSNSIIHHIKTQAPMSLRPCRGTDFEGKERRIFSSFLNYNSK